MISSPYFFLPFFSFLLFLLFLPFFSSFFLHFFLSHFFFLSFAITILLCMLDFRLCTQMVQPLQRCQFSITNQKWIRIGIVTILIVIHENVQCSSKVLKVLFLSLCCFCCLLGDYARQRQCISGNISIVFHRYYRL